VAPIVGAGAGEVDVVMTGIPAVGSKTTFPDITSVDVEVIQESDGASAGSGTLTYNGTNYSGRITVTGSGNLVFVGLAKNGTEVRYLGNGSMVSGGTSVTITTGTTGGDSPTVLGMRGPGGGWIYNAKDAYSNGWRFLEAAPIDLSLDWTADYIDTENNQIINGDVYDRSATPVLQLSKYDWYWGPAGTMSTTPYYTYLTTAPVGDGYANTYTRLNTDNLDATTTVTPKLKKGKARKTPVVGVDNLRRDTPDTLQTWTVNGIGSWHIPSKDELDAMYSKLKASSPSKGNFQAAYYWSSTEDLTADQWTVESGINIPNGNARNFGTSSGSEEKTRDTPYRVRPSRRF
jgi:hypothetical protein